jgi:hypothetical protein
MPQSWSKDEEKQLLKEIKSGKSYNELAKIHNRSISALIMRFNKIIYENIENKKTKSSLANLLNITLDKINQAYYEHKAFLEKKGIEKKSIEKKSIVKPIKTKSTITPKSSVRPKSTNPTKTNTNTNEDKIKIYIKKINILEKENKLLKEINENMKLKKKLGQKINNNDLLKKILHTIKSNRNK